MERIPDLAEFQDTLHARFPLPPECTLSDMCMVGAAFKNLSDAALGDVVLRLVYQLI